MVSTSELAPEGRRLLRLEARNSADPDRAEAAVDQDPGAYRAAVHGAAEPGQGGGPAHGVPGGRLPEHLRVLGRPRGDLPHRRRPVHPALRLLPDRHRQAAAAGHGTSRGASPSRWPRWGCGTPRSPAWPATTCPTARPGCTRRPRGRSTRRCPAAGSSCSCRTSTPSPRSSPRCSAPRPRCSRTTWRRCRGSSAASGRASGTSGRWRCCGRRTRPGWSPSRT